MTSLRILADDLTGALDCAAAFGAGVPVHLGRPAATAATAGLPVEIVATATRDVPPGELPALLAPSVEWLRGAGVAFKKVDSLLRGNTFHEASWLAGQGGFEGIVFAPAFPAQGRVTEAGQQWIVRPGEARTPARAETIAQVLGAQAGLWVPDVRSDAEMDAVAALALQPGAARRLWCGSAGLAHALARRMGVPSAGAAAAPVAGPPMLVSASHHAVSREQWRVLRGSRWADQCHAGTDPASLRREAAGYPRLIDLSPETLITAGEAAALLERQAALIARHAPRPGALVVVGGDTLLALCRALGAGGLRSAPALERPGWGSAQLVGGRWDGLVCHTRSGAFGGPGDLLDVMDALAAARA
ncbi:four-carbon acid sugar kinase family protein [Azohydromonas aeria]|uniref:four-carbon acid sugar kinase family protein n=1 Tax=Azohydromonas aeria TaxID=2590212 RepID=UPI0012F91291|nr:four-carbon acid sugar kinase family protein [Azohydromonas aeria]